MFRLILITIILSTMSGCGMFIEPPRVVVSGPHWGGSYNHPHYKTPQHHRRHAQYNPGLAERIYRKCSGNQTCMHGEWHKVDAQRAQMRYRHGRSDHYEPRYVQPRRGHRVNRSNHRNRRPAKRHRRNRRR